MNSSESSYYNHPIENITTVSIAWFTKNKKETKIIKLKQVTVEPMYIKSPILRQMKTRKLCPATPDIGLVCFFE